MGEIRGLAATAEVPLPYVVGPQGPARRLLGLLGRNDVRLSAAATVGNGVARLGNVVGVLIASRVLGADSFGRFALVQAALIALTAFLGFGFPVAAQVLAPRDHVESWGRHLCRRVLLAAGVGAAVTEVAAVVILAVSSTQDALHETARLLALSAWTLVPSTVLPVRQALLSVAMRRRSFTTSLAAQGAGSAVLVPLGAVVAGVPGALYGYGAAAALACAVSRWSRPEPGGDPRITFGFQEVAPVAGAAYVATVLWAGALWASQIFLSRHGGNVEVAHFAIGLRFFTLISFIPAAAATFVIPMLRSRRHTAGAAVARRYASKLLAVTFVLAVLVAATAIGGALIVLPLLGDAFADGRRVTSVLCVAGVFSALNTVLGQVFLADRGVRHWFISDVLLAVVLVGLAAVLVRPLGALGLALAYAVAYIATCAYLLAARHTPVEEV